MGQEQAKEGNVDVHQPRSSPSTAGNNSSSNFVSSQSRSHNMSAQPHSSHHLHVRIAALEEKMRQLITQTDFDILQVRIQQNQLLCEKHQLHAQTAVKENKKLNKMMEERITKLTQKLADEEKRSRELDVKCNVEKQRISNLEGKLENSIKLYRELEEKFMDLEKKYKQMEDRTVPEVSTDTSSVGSSQLDVSSVKESVWGATALPVERVDFITKLFQEAACTTQNGSTKDDSAQKTCTKDEQLFTYSKSGNVAEVESIVAAGANVNAVDDKGKSPLHYAAQQGHVRTCEHLLLMGAHVNAHDKNNNTPLHEASMKGQLYVVQRLVSHGAFVSSKNADKRTPLHLAAFAGHTSVCEFLLDHGARPNARDHNLATPLFAASWFGHVNVVELLIKRRADLDVADFKERTPLHHAAFRGHQQVCEKLLQAGAAVDATDIKNNTPLHSAVMKGRFEIVKMLVRHGADVYLRGGKASSTALELAEHYGRSEIEYWLYEHC